MVFVFYIKLIIQCIFHRPIPSRTHALLYFIIRTAVAHIIQMIDTVISSVRIGALLVADLSFICQSFNWLNLEIAHHIQGIILGNVVTLIGIHHLGNRIGGIRIISKPTGFVQVIIPIILFALMFFSAT